jgi:hypothetical protein
MPFLHWDLQTRHEWRTKTMEALDPGTGITPPRWTTDEQRDGSLLYSYLWDRHTRHLLHPRRSLDQYYHHAFDTRDRDGDQVISRFQKRKGLDPGMHVLTVVDQLWVWVLVGSSGQADTVISCFPQTESPKTPDTEGVSDVLEHIKLHLLTDPSSIKSAYDIAAVIASKCSRAYLGHGSLQPQLRFAEVYEATIGDAVS